MSAIFHLLYSSAATSLVTEKMIEDILSASRKNNVLAEVKGILLCRSGHFLQILEGKESQVRQVYRNILRDRRHSNSVVLAEFQSPIRIFPGWNMGYIEDKKVTGALSYRLNSMLESQLPISDDIKNEVVALLRAMSQPQMG